MEAWQLTLLFPTEVGSSSPSLDIDVRMQKIKDELLSDGLVNSKVPFTHPEVTKLLGIWKAYLITGKEDFLMYDKLKKAFITMWGENMFGCWLHMTYYFARTEWMQQHKYSDTNFREP